MKNDKKPSQPFSYPGYLTNRRILSYTGGQLKKAMHGQVYAPLALSFEKEEYSAEEVERVLNLIEWFYVRFWYTKQGAKISATKKRKFVVGEYYRTL